MGKQNSKVNREKDEFDKEHEKKVRFQMQKLQDKNEGKDGFSKYEKIRLENEQQRPSEETKQIEKGGVIRNPSSVDSTEFETGTRMEKKDSDSDKAIDKVAITLERTEYGECTNLHTYALHKTYCNGSALAQSLCLDTHEQDFTEKSGKDRCRNLGNKDTNNDLHMEVNNRAEEKVSIECGQTQEQHFNPEFIDIQFRRTTIDFTVERETIVDTDIDRVNQDGSGRKQTKVDSTNSEIFARIENGNATSTAEERLTKYVKNIHLRTNLEINKPINTASSKLSKALYDIYSKYLCAKILSFKNYKHHFTFNPACSNNDRPLNVFVYAIGVKGRSMLIGVYEDKHIIKCILETPTLRDRYSGDEHFRLATFSLSVFDYELGEIIRLAGTGFFCDADGSVKCYCSGITHTSDGHVGRSIEEHYGVSAPGTLVPSEQNVQGYITEAFFDIRIQRRSFFNLGLGRTRQIFQDDSLVPEEEIDVNENVLSVREGSMQPSQLTEYSANTFSVIEGPMHSKQETLQSSNGLFVREVPMPSKPETLQSSNGLSMRESPMPSRHGTPHSAIHFSAGEGPMHTKQETPKGTNIEESVQDSCVNNMGILNGNQGRCVSSRGHKVEGSLGQGSVDVPLNSERRTGRFRESSNDLLPLEQTERHMLNTGRRTIKEDVNRGSPTKTARLDAENTRMRRRTLCCKCKVRRCNFVFIPCGHLVICNVCVSNTTVCPVCKTKVNEAIEVDDQFI